MDTTTDTGIADAIAAVGSQEQLAAAIGTSQQNVSFWKRQGFVPVEHIVAVEQASGVPRARLIKPKILDLLRDPMA